MSLPASAKLQGLQSCPFLAHASEREVQGVNLRTFRVQAAATYSAEAKKETTCVANHGGALYYISRNANEVPRSQYHAGGTLSPGSTGFVKTIPSRNKTLVTTEKVTIAPSGVVEALWTRDFKSNVSIEISFSSSRSNTPTLDVPADLRMERALLKAS